MTKNFRTRAPLLLALLTTCAFAAPAAQARTVLYEIKGEWVSFSDFPDKRILIDSSCVHEGNLDCKAFKALKRASLKGLDAQRTFGANPGAVVCRFRLKGEVVIGKSKAGGENAFCQFKDGSIVDTGTLHWYARENDSGK